MTQDNPKSNSGTKKPKTNREDKLAQALRDNLRRRKQAAADNKKSDN